MLRLQKVSVQISVEITIPECLDVKHSGSTMVMVLSPVLP